jgi:hypothetical protein
MGEPQGPRNVQPDGAFHWRQLESADYGTYIANLRKIECPERTIRDIITADIHALYERRHADLNRQDYAEPTLARRLRTHQLLEERHARLHQEETAVLLALLGPVASEYGQTAAEYPAPTASSADSPIEMPVVLQDVDAGQLNLDPGQLQAITNLRQLFVTSVGGANQDPADPGYRGRWQESQPEFDDLLRGLLGGEDYQNYEIAARIKASMKNRNQVR